MSELVSTVARIMTADELRAEGGAEALAAAEAATRIQYEKTLPIEPRLSLAQCYPAEISRLVAAFPF